MQWARRLWNEQRAQKIDSALYIGERRHALRISAIRDSAADSSPIRTGGTYLITGGLGGLGYLIAEHFARRYAARLILVGRSAADASTDRKLEALAALGAQAIYASADVADGGQLRAAARRGREKFGALHGIVHAAGVESSGTILSRDRCSIETVLRPKISGTVLLEELSRDASLDFICYFSSISAVLGDFGTCDYAVANRFQLAHAKYAARNALAICWPVWAEGGMAFDDEGAARLYLKATGQRAMRASEGIDLMERALALHGTTGATHALVVAGQRDRVHRMLGVSAPATEVGSAAAPADLAERAESATEDLRQRVSRDLQEIVGKLLKLPLDRLYVDDNLAEFGFDSIGLAELARRLSIHFGVEVSPALFFSRSNLSKLTQYFLRNHAEAVRSRYRHACAAAAVGREDEQATAGARRGAAESDAAE
ncbi:MAG: beta-ketoacyl reductase, partial [Steroidobacteraceae bacterium]